MIGTFAIHNPKPMTPMIDLGNVPQDVGIDSYDQFFSSANITTTGLIMFKWGPNSHFFLIMLKLILFMHIWDNVLFLGGVSY